MKLSNFPLFTLRDVPSDAGVPSHQLMLRSGMIKKVGLGLYSFLPLGQLVLQRVITIVREEMNSIGALEITMPIVQPASLWKESGRFNKYGPELVTFKDRNEHEHCLGPTHEEVITSIAASTIQSAAQLPICFYQIHTKFRDEIRPRFGIMRAREFLMKDAYSFHLDANSLELTYQDMVRAYHSIFKRCQLNFAMVEADNGAIGGTSSHEFHVLANTGEDILAENNGRAFNIELLPHFQIDDPSTHHTSDGLPLTITRGIEVGHVFKLGDTYCKSFSFTLTNSSQQTITPTMGCYGIGVSRICASAIEQNHDAKGIIWNPSLAPFHVVIALINPQQSSNVTQAGNQLYQTLQKQSLRVALDDRGLRVGVMLHDLELIGIPLCVIIGERGLAQNQVEIKIRQRNETIHATTTDAPSIIEQIINELS
ncbi:MAG: proline--tRNA ligase [Methylacidiphilales bacterium]|nr:proline--tRNA ligase [Candidatus Methylacidiphilales bacterium]